MSATDEMLTTIKEYRETASAAEKALRSWEDKATYTVEEQQQMWEMLFNASNAIRRQQVHIDHLIQIEEIKDRMLADCKAFHLRK
jgi:hypothetical protein